MFGMVAPELMDRLLSELRTEEVLGAEHLIAVLRCAGLVPEDEADRWWIRLEELRLSRCQASDAREQ